jgi:hypothetical protein
MEELSQKSNLRKHERILTVGKSWMAATSYVSSKSYFLFSVIQQDLFCLFLWPTIQSSLEIKTPVMNIPSRPKFNSDLAVLPDSGWELYVSSITVSSDRNEENGVFSTNGPAPSICYMWEMKPTLFSHFMCGLHFSTHSQHCLLTLWIWEVFLRDSPCSCLSEKSYKRGTCFVAMSSFGRMKEIWGPGSNGSWQ